MFVWTCVRLCQPGTVGFILATAGGRIQVAAGDRGANSAAGVLSAGGS